MKKLILAFVALAFAFAISSCCDQQHGSENTKCKAKQEGIALEEFDQEPSHRLDQPQSQPRQERSSRRW